ncbi:helix-turn-helix domain-containing protein [Plantactinospora sp. WMMC1484]|uniref:helix-turn-helix domain-containing protein n=1 Tax=Plantactinospora sp. WMMC1484 TaxID=3404122 RepID=UPI003BF4A785
MAEAAGDACGPGTLAGRLDRLFDRIRKPDGTPYSLREVADATAAQGESISHTYIGQLRTGKKSDPNLSHLRALARFFGVPVEYFTSDRLAADVDRELDLAAALQQVRARTVALRNSVIPEAQSAIDALTQLLGVIRVLEQGKADADDGP